MLLCKAWEDWMMEQAGSSRVRFFLFLFLISTPPPLFVLLAPLSLFPVCLLYTAAQRQANEKRRTVMDARPYSCAPLQAPWKERKERKKKNLGRKINDERGTVTDTYTHTDSFFFLSFLLFYIVSCCLILERHIAYANDLAKKNKNNK